MTDESPVPQNENANDSEPVLTLIKQIKENKLEPQTLSVEQRRCCVEIFWREGLSIPETAQILKRGERTIHRDREEIRSANALRLRPRFAVEMAGELIRQAECSISRLRRIAREARASAMERLMAEGAAFKVHIDMLSKLQSMGYLPRVPTGVVAQVVGQGAAVPIATYEQISQRLQELDCVDQELGVIDPEQQATRRTLRELVERGRTAAQVDQMLESKGDN